MEALNNNLSLVLGIFVVPANGEKFSALKDAYIHKLTTDHSVKFLSKKKCTCFSIADYLTIIKPMDLSIGSYSETNLFSNRSIFICVIPNLFRSFWVCYFSD